MNKDQELTIEEYAKLVERLSKEIDRLNSTRESWYAEKRYLDGLIDGLKFSIRCNGVSGDEVK